MSRHLTILALVAAPALALAACDAPSTLSKAQPGECYAVVGRDGVGAPKLAKTACAGSPAALAAACPKPQAPTVAACPTSGVKVAAGGHRASSGHVKVRASGRRVQTTRYARVAQSTHYASRDDRVANSGEVTSLGIEYARVGEELAGGYERRETHDQFDYGPPPPPPPVARRHQAEASVQYSERSRQSSSYRESYSSSSRGGYGYGYGYGYGEADCGCEGGGRGQPPHSPFDRNGYLTWRGKTPG
jgi:hypothetical protein